MTWDNIEIDDASEDFASWEWGNDFEQYDKLIAAISTEAAKLVMKEITASLGISIELSTGEARIRVDCLGAGYQWTGRLQDMIAEYVENHANADGSPLTDEYGLRSDTIALIHSLEDACTKLREML